MFFDAALPYYEYRPTEHSQFTAVSFVSLAVPFQLWFPIRQMGFRNMPVDTRVLVPKTPTHLYYSFESFQDDIGPARQITIETESKTLLMEGFAEEQFGLGIP
jgi:hypothetical protein